MRKIYEVTDLKTTMPVDGTGEYLTENLAEEAATRLKLKQKGIKYMITWYTK
jgi:hypothetical protein